jgi:hypothetical protein
MSKGDWEEVEVRRDDETPVTEKSSCEMYGHTYEIDKDDNGEPVVGPDGGVLRTCNDCGDTYQDAPDDICVDADDNTYPEHDYDEVDCRRCGAEPEN